MIHNQHLKKNKHDHYETDQHRAKTKRKEEERVLTTEMRCNGSKPCQVHIKRQDSEKKGEHRTSSAQYKHHS